MAFTSAGSMTDIATAALPHPAFPGAAVQRGSDFPDTTTMGVADLAHGADGFSFAATSLCQLSRPAMCAVTAGEMLWLTLAKPGATEEDNFDASGSQAYNMHVSRVPDSDAWGDGMNSDGGGWGDGAAAAWCVVAGEKGSLPENTAWCGVAAASIEEGSSYFTHIVAGATNAIFPASLVVQAGTTDIRAGQDVLVSCSSTQAPICYVGKAKFAESLHGTVRTQLYI